MTSDRNLKIPFLGRGKIQFECTDITRDCDYVFLDVFEQSTILGGPSYAEIKRADHQYNLLVFLLSSFCLPPKLTANNCTRLSRPNGQTSPGKVKFILRHSSATEKVI